MRQLRRWTWNKREQQQERYVTLATEAVSKAQQDVIDERHVIDQLLKEQSRLRKLMDEEGLDPC